MGERTAEILTDVLADVIGQCAGSSADLHLVEQMSAFFADCRVIDEAPRVVVQFPTGQAFVIEVRPIN